MLWSSILLPLADDYGRPTGVVVLGQSWLQADKLSRAAVACAMHLDSPKPAVVCRSASYSVLLHLNWTSTPPSPWGGGLGSTCSLSIGVKVRVGTEAAACPAYQDLVHKEAARPSKIFSLQLWSSSFCSLCVLLFSPSGLSLPPSLLLRLLFMSYTRSVTLCPSAGKDMTDYRAIKSFPCGLHSSRAT